MTHFTHYFIVCEFGSNVFNQVHTWFTKLLLKSVCVCMHVCMHVSMWRVTLPSFQLGKDTCLLVKAYQFTSVCVYKCNTVHAYS